MNIKDLYQHLGLPKTASISDIKEAYKKLALNAHPDKGGSHEKMAILNEAYQTLSNPKTRREFDQRLRAFQETEQEPPESEIAEAALEAGDMVRFSQRFRAEHQSMIAQFRQTPVERRVARSGLKVEGASRLDIFSFIGKKKVTKASKAPFTPTESEFTTLAAISLFRDFLAGNFTGNSLVALNDYFVKQLANYKRNHHGANELLLLEGISEILSMAVKKPADKSPLISSIGKITDFAKTCDENTLLQLIPLLYNTYFRNLFTHALHLYWQSEYTAEREQLLFDGEQEARELLGVLREHLSRGEQSEGFVELVQQIKLLASLEKELQSSKKEVQTANIYREKAFTLLDWVSTVKGISSRTLLANTFTQIGTHFQRAAMLEHDHPVKMADQKLALKMYLTAVSIAQHITPDLEIYVNTHALRSILAFEFNDQLLEVIILALQERTIVLGEIFPIFTEKQSNIAFLRGSYKPIHLMRRLLNVMMQQLEYNKTHIPPIVIEHTSVDILYSTYEACLKNWYQENFDPALESKVRLSLMEALLEEKGWTVEDVERSLSAPWVMVNRDEQGWMRASLPFSQGEAPSFQTFRSIHGAEINLLTKEITFVLEPWQASNPDYEKAFSLFDIQELLKRKLTGAIFSLDPVDPHKQYHPFNTMRFAPSQTYESELMHTMLLTDYILKFLTTKQEVQGKYPFERRSIDRLIAHLPDHLKKIIDDFHLAQREESIHRFWIEAEQMDASFNQQQGSIRIELGDIRMVIKKHLMERNAQGELKDTDSEKEGWTVYSLTRMQVNELRQGLRKIEDRAMIFIQDEENVILWENNKVLLDLIPEEDDLDLELLRGKLEKDGKFIVKNQIFLYQIEKEICRQAGVPTHYSPELVFANEFTLHYDEFARYIPEFGRLKQLSKLCALIRILNNLHQESKDSIEAINFLTSERGKKSLVPESGMYKTWHEERLKIRNKIISQFQQWRPQYDSDSLMSHHMKRLEEERDKRIFYRIIKKIPLISDLIEINRLVVFQKYVDPVMAATLSEAKAQYPDCSDREICSALRPDSLEVLNQFADRTSYRRLEAKKMIKEKILSSFTKMGFVEKETPIDHSKQCCWVPATVRHEANEKTSGLFFVYGGVNIQPKLNIKSEAVGTNRQWTQSALRYSAVHLTGKFIARSTLKERLKLERASMQAAAARGPVPAQLTGAKSWQEIARETEKAADAPFAPGSVGAGKTWTVKGRMEAAKLPHDGEEVRFIPKKGYKGTTALRRGNNHGFLDDYDNEWCKGPSRTPSEPFEWDVILSPRGHKVFEKIYNERFPHKNYSAVKHLNISLKGRITH